MDIPIDGRIVPYRRCLCPHGLTVSTLSLPHPRTPRSHSRYLSNHRAETGFRRLFSFCEHLRAGAQRRVETLRFVGSLVGIPPRRSAAARLAPRTHQLRPHACCSLPHPNQPWIAAGVTLCVILYMTASPDGFRDLWSQKLFADGATDGDRLAAAAQARVRHASGDSGDPMLATVVPLFTDLSPIETGDVRICAGADPMPSPAGMGHISAETVCRWSSCRCLWARKVLGE